MSLFWKKKQSDETGDQVPQEEVAPKSRQERVKENAHSWLNLEKGSDMPDKDIDENKKLFREGLLKDASGKSTSTKNELDPALFTLDTKTDDVERTALKQKQSSVDLKNSDTEASLFDLDSTLFKKAKRAPLSESENDHISDTRTTASDSVPPQKKSSTTPQNDQAASTNTSKPVTAKDSSSRVLAFKTVPKSTSAKQEAKPSVMPTQPERENTSKLTPSGKLSINAQSSSRAEHTNDVQRKERVIKTKHVNPHNKVDGAAPEAAKITTKRVKVTPKVQPRHSQESEAKVPPQEKNSESAPRSSIDEGEALKHANVRDHQQENLEAEQMSAQEQASQHVSHEEEPELDPSIAPEQPKKERPASKWHSHLEKLESVDPLVDCLVSLTKHFDNPYSADGIRAGLPISDSGMTPELFMRAAKRVGLVTRFVKRPLAKIAHVLLPVVLLLEDNQACVLLEIDADNQQVKVFMPESGEGEVYLPLSQLLDLYSGYCFFIRPQFRFDKRSMAAADVQTHGKHWFWGTLTSSWRIYRDVVIASLLINLFAIASPLFVMNVYDRVVPNNAFDTLWVLAIGATVVYGFDFLLRSLRAYFIDVAGKKSDILMSASIFSKVNNITMASRPRSVGAFAKNLQDFESIRDFITSASVTTLVDIPFMFLIVSIIYLIGGPVGLIPMVTISLVFLYSMAIQRPLRRSIEEGQKTSMQKNAVLIESLSNAETVKLSNAQGTLQQQWEQAVGNISDWGLKTKQLAQSCSSFAMVAQQMTTVAMVVVGVYMISEHEMSMGALVACVMLTGRALSPMAQFAGLAARYNHAKSAYSGLKDIMASPVEQPDDMKFVHRPRFDGSFEFDDVSFSYPEQEQEAVSNINLHIKSGEKVAIIGRIGSGKSTLGKLMMGLYQPKSGALRVDGIDMRQINPVDLRRNVGAVSQDVSLFYGSIKDNICFGVPFIEDEAIIRAADLSGVSEFANRKASGLDSVVGERGQHLSGGQRQSVAIARALLFDPNILVLDEPTASMDNTTEARMRRRLANVVEDKTLIIITHKSSMLDLVDRVVVMDNGRILADGPKAHVLEALRQGKLKVS